MNKELLNIVKELSEKPTTELALQFMELNADNIIKDKEIQRLNNIINEAKEECKSVIGNPEHTIVSKNELMKLMLNILNKGDNNE